MFGRFGPGEIAVIVLLVLVIFGAKRLPELGRSLGLGLTNFRQAIKGGEPKPEETPPPPVDGQSPGVKSSGAKSSGAKSSGNDQK